MTLLKKTFCFGVSQEINLLPGKLIKEENKHSLHPCQGNQTEQGKVFLTAVAPPISEEGMTEHHFVSPHKHLDLDVDSYGTRDTMCHLMQVPPKQSCQENQAELQQPETRRQMTQFLQQNKTIKEKHL